MESTTVKFNANPFTRVPSTRPEGTVLLAADVRWVQGTSVSADWFGDKGRVAAFAGGLVIAPSAQRYMDVAYVRTGEPPV